MNTSERILVGVGAVVFRGDHVLVIKRKKPPFLGHWSIPGGGLEYGERLVDAAHREVREETSIEIKILGLLDAFEALPREADQFVSHTIMIDYVAEWVSGEPIAGDDAAEAEFVSIDEAMSRLSWDQTRMALSRAIKFREEFAKTP
ncbi:NUDIX hydrolase [Hyphococcus lacteus]|uniref:NUDIX hydrolase n=1 Tax=Hyphococcus lacteus TaxID=3143536 RepID=A0ABV3YZK3_9PROT